MADISAELQAILDATYGEEVRGSIHDAIEKINTVNEEGVADIENLSRAVNADIENLSQAVNATVNIANAAVNGWPRIAVITWSCSVNRTIAANATDTIVYGLDMTYDPSTTGITIIPEFAGDLDLIHNYERIRYGSPSTACCHFVTDYAMRPWAGEISDYYIIHPLEDAYNYIEPRRPSNAKLEIKEVYTYISEWNNVSHPVMAFTVKNLTSSPQELKVENSGHMILMAIPVDLTGDGNETLQQVVERLGSVPISMGTGSKSMIEGSIEDVTEGEATIVAKNTASGNYSHAEGEGTKAESEAQHVSGKYNVADSQGAYAEIIGNGSANNARSNARTLDWDGNEWLAGYLELGPDKARLTPEMISHIDGIVSTIKSMLTTETVNGNPIILDDAAENMEPVELEVGLLYTKDESTGAITGYTSGSVTVNSDVITTNFPQEAGLVCGGKYDPVNGTLTVTKIGVQAAWGDMIFSIDPDNYLGKRIALTDCFGGLAGAEISDCHVLSGRTNLSPDYIYDQSAATHFYVYNDNIDSYAVVVLPDTTPSDAVITVVGTLKNPITYELTASEILLALEDNTISSNMNAPMKLTYYHDAIRQEQADIQNAKPIFSDPNNDGNIVIYFADEV